MAAADFNGDGHTDLAVTSLANPGWVTTFLRNAANTGFTSEGAATAGVNPRDLVATDFNSDGRPDLAITNLGGASVTVLLRNPERHGFTQEGSPVPVGASPEGIVAADLNGDGRPDLAVANLGDGGVTILLRQAAGGFAAEGPTVPTGAGALGVAAADFNGDGRPDLAVTNNTAGTVSVLLRQAGGGFAADTGSPISAPGANGISAADFNGDGRPDLAASDGGSTLRILMNTTPAPLTPVVATPPAPPVPGKSVVVRVVSGKVRIKRPGHGYVTLTDPANVPVGSLVDTRKRSGRVHLGSRHRRHEDAETAQFYDGIFQIKQAVPRKKPKKPTALTTDLVLKGQISRSQCAPLKGAGSGCDQQEEGPHERARQALGQRQGQVPHHGQVQLGDRARDDLADAGPVQRDPDEGATRCRQRARLQAQEDRLGQGRPHYLARAQRAAERATLGPAARGADEQRNAHTACAPSAPLMRATSSGPIRSSSWAHTADEHVTVSTPSRSPVGSACAEITSPTAVGQTR